MDGWIDGIYCVSCPFLLIQPSCLFSLFLTCLVSDRHIFQDRSDKIGKRKCIPCHRRMMQNIKQNIDFIFVNLIFKCLNGLGPEPLWVNLWVNCSRSTSCADCKVLLRKTSFAQTSFFMRWAKLPVHFKASKFSIIKKKRTQFWLIQRQHCSSVSTFPLFHLV